MVSKPLCVDSNLVIEKISIQFDQYLTWQNSYKAATVKHYSLVKS